MIFERIQLENEGNDAYIDAYVADKTDKFTRKAILVIPGGGYCDVCSSREGEPVAMAFMPYGYNAFVLHYSVVRSGKIFPAQLIQASKAIKHIKDNAERYNIDPDKVFVTGFSAGGHLTASIGVLWHLKEIYDAVDMPYGYNKPAGIMPIYPVISSDPEFGHIDSHKNLWCTTELTPEQAERTCLEKHVDEKSSPAFIMHTSNDACVNVRNALAFAEAYAKIGRTFELHIYPDAPHGSALSNKITSGGWDKFENPQIAKWVEQAAAWADSL